jgi:hypothetical protein
MDTTEKGIKIEALWDKLFLHDALVISCPKGLVATVVKELSKHKYALRCKEPELGLDGLKITAGILDDEPELLGDSDSIKLRLTLMPVHRAADKMLPITLVEAISDSLDESLMQTKETVNETSKS